MEKRGGSRDERVTGCGSEGHCLVGGTGIGRGGSGRSVEQMSSSENQKNLGGDDDFFFFFLRLNILWVSAEGAKWCQGSVNKG